MFSLTCAYCKISCVYALLYYYLTACRRPAQHSTCTALLPATRGQWLDQRHTPRAVRCSEIDAIAGQGGAASSCRDRVPGDATAAGRGGGGGGDGEGLRVRDIGLVAAGQVRLRQLRVGPRLPPQPGWP
jgi:hypothetical protein